MKIALLNAFPNLSHSAEKEFIERCLADLGTLGHDAYSVITSDDIIALNPDIVIVTHEFVAKTTDHFTVGLLWSPTEFYKNEAQRVKAIRSWDLVVPINAATRRFAKSIHFPLRHATAVSDLNFYPSASTSDLPLPDASSLSLAYIGAHWDGDRHKAVFEEIAKVADLHVYGPAKAWTFLPNNYRGPVPFDGKSVVKTLNQHGVVLAVHKTEHALEETPSMRVFEACSARCIVITEPMQPLVELFGDSIHYVDMSRPPAEIAQNVAAILGRYKANPSLAEQTIQQAEQVFKSKASLERLLSALLDDVKERLEKSRSAALAARQDLEVSVIIRCGSRPYSFLKRAVASLASQTYPKIGLIFVRFAEMDGFQSWLEAIRATGRFTFVKEVEAPGNGMRSAAMWAGLRAVATDAFCMLDDDDEIFAGHIAGLVKLLVEDESCDFAYSGVVLQEEDGAYLNDHVRFKGELQAEIKERRALKFLDDFNLDRLLRFDNYIQSNAWLARKRVLTPDVLDDPDLAVSEDMYFYLLLASRYKFRFTGNVSAIWNWRSIAADNSMVAVPPQHWQKNGEMLLRRLARVSFPGGYEGCDVLLNGRIPRKPAASELPAAAQTRSFFHSLLRTITGRHPSPSK